MLETIGWQWSSVGGSLAVYDSMFSGKLSTSLQNYGEGRRGKRSKGRQRGWKEIGRMKAGCLKPWLYVVEQKLHSYGGKSYSRRMTQAVKKKLSFLPLWDWPSLAPSSPFPHYAYSIVLTHTHTHTHTHTCKHTSTHASTHTYIT